MNDDNIKIDSLVNGFIGSVVTSPDHPALFVSGQTYTYRQLQFYAGAIAAAILKTEDSHPLVAVWASRSLPAYGGVLGILLTGKGYVPLNPRFPVERTREMLIASGCRVVIVGRECLADLPMLLEESPYPLGIILPDSDFLAEYAKGESRHTFYMTENFVSNPYIPKEVKTDSAQAAYLLFTSGSTGAPKGIVVSQLNATSYIGYITSQYQISSQDRFSQLFDLTFDLSVHDMFVCWSSGACLFCVPQNSLLGPAKFIQDKKLTMWFSVPSAGMFMSRLRMLKTNAFPSLRLSLFCGEVFPAVLAEEWQAAAPNSVVENLYGPTETTIAISRYRWDKNISSKECINGIVPIGSVFNDHNYCLLDESRRSVECEGELWLSGPQVTNGYLNDRTKTLEQFIPLPNFKNSLGYCTGDIVRADKNGTLHYLHRSDEQVQILGHRVELREVEEVIRKVSGYQQVSCLAWPLYDGIAQSIAGFVLGSNNDDEKSIIQSCRRYLPDYMVPTRIFFIEEAPLNQNGKIDRQQLQKIADSLVQNNKGNANVPS